MMISRRSCLIGAGGALAGAAALAQQAHAARDRQQGLYLHGLAWNTELPGAAGEFLLTFEAWADLQAGTGFGSVSDAVHPAAGLHFAVIAAQRQGNRLALEGKVIRANSPANLNRPVRLEAEFH